MDEQFQKLKNIIAEKFGVPQHLITAEAELTGDLNLSNLEITDLIALVSEHFELRFQEGHQIEKAHKVSDLINLIEIYSEEL